MTLPLSGIKVLEFSEHGFVPSAAAALADWGADVIKIERPEGDPMRSIIRNGLVAQADGTDYLFELVNRNKRGIALDVTVLEGRAVFEKLVAWADVYITNQLPRVRRKLKTEPADLFAINAKLVFAKGHGQGQRGEDAEAGGFDSVSFWMRGGTGHMLTSPGAERLVMQRPAQGDVPTGMFMAGGVCAALVHAARTGEGMVVDTSLMSGAMWSLGPDMAYSSIMGSEPPRHGGALRGMSPLVGEYVTADGRFMMLSMLDDERYWVPTFRALGLEEVIEQYPDDATRRPAWDDLREVVKQRIATKTKAELALPLRDANCIFSFASAPHEVLNDQATIDNGYAMTHPTHPTMKLPATPQQFDDEMPSIRRAAPRHGEHTAEVLTMLGYTTTEIEAMEQRGTATTAAPS